MVVYLTFKTWEWEFDDVIYAGIDKDKATDFAKNVNDSSVTVTSRIEHWIDGVLDESQTIYFD